MTIKVGLAGFGLAGRVLHRPLILAAGMEITAVVSRQQQLVEEQLPNAVVFPDFDSMLVHGDVNLVVITTPNHLHASQALAALSAGKHVVVDKPMALTPPDIATMIRVAGTQQRLLTPFHNRRWDSDFLTVRRLLSEAALGEIHHYEAHWDRYRPQVVARWREDAAHGGGILTDLGPHLIDQSLLLFGPPEWLEAEVLKQRTGAQVEDAFEIRMGKGKITIKLGASSLIAQPTPRFQIEGSTASFIKYGLDEQENQLRAGMTPSAVEYGIELTKQWGRLTDKVTGIERVIPAEKGDWPAYYQQLRLSIESKQAVPVPASAGLLVAQIIEAARLSNEQGRRIHFHTW